MKPVLDDRRKMPEDKYRCVCTYEDCVYYLKIYYWQEGKVLPSVDHLLALSAVFNVPMNDILVMVTPPKGKVHREPQRRRKKLGECILCMAA